MPATPLKVLSSTMPAWSSHFTKWHTCTQCSIGTFASNHVFCRGRLPCEVLFLGEAPGNNEDAFGIPFVGKAGKIFDELVFDIAAAIEFGGLAKNEQLAALFKAKQPGRLRWAVTNVIVCRPANNSAAPFREPSVLEKRNCRPRLEEFIYQVAKPRCILAMGAHAQHAAMFLSGIPWWGIPHPSRILHNGGLEEPAGRRMYDEALSKAVTFVREMVN